MTERLTQSKHEDRAQERRPEAPAHQATADLSQSLQQGRLPDVRADGGTSKHLSAADVRTDCFIFGAKIAGAPPRSRISRFCARSASTVHVRAARLENTASPEVVVTEAGRNGHGGHKPPPLDNNASPEISVTEGGRNGRGEHKPLSLRPDLLTERTVTQDAHGEHRVPPLRPELLPEKT